MEHRPNRSLTHASDRRAPSDHVGLRTHPVHEQSRHGEYNKTAGGGRDRDRSRSRERSHYSIDPRNRRDELEAHKGRAGVHFDAEQRQESRLAATNGSRPAVSSAYSRSELASTVAPPGPSSNGLADGALQSATGDGDVDEDPDAAMAAILGFSGFDSTKGKPVEDNQKGPAKGAAKQVLQRKYRQYMNRVGGFNRFLDAMK